jgi:hypothetical protein
MAILQVIFCLIKKLKSILTSTKKQSAGKAVQVYHCIPTMTSRYPRKEKAIAFANI